MGEGFYEFNNFRTRSLLQYLYTDMRSYYCLYYFGIIHIPKEDEYKKRKAFHTYDSCGYSCLRLRYLGYYSEYGRPFI